MTKQPTSSPALNGAGKQYGWWCTKWQHVWSDQADADKCCHPDWQRCLAVRSGMDYDIDVVYTHYWAPVPAKADLALLR